MPRPALRITIAHSWIRTNLGDVLLCVELARFVRKQRPDAELVVAVPRPWHALTLAYYARQYGVTIDAITLDGLEPRLPERTDALLSPGGEFVTSIFPLLEPLAHQARHCRRLGIPLAVCGQSVGPFADAADQALALDFLRAAELVMVREPASFALLSAHDLPGKLVLSGDWAFGLADGGPRTGTHLGVNLRGGAFGRQEIEATEALSQRLNLPLRAYTTDRHTDKAVLDALAHRGHRVERQARNYQTLPGEIAHHDRLTLTDRFHGALFSLLAGVPPLALHPYAHPGGLRSHKMQGMLGALADASLPEFAAAWDPQLVESARRWLHTPPATAPLVRHHRAVLADGQAELAAFLAGLTSGRHPRAPLRALRLPRAMHGIAGLGGRLITT